MREISFTLPWPPTSNHLRIPIRRGKSMRLITSSEGRNYYAMAAIEIVTQGVKRDAMAGRISIAYKLHAPDRRRYDIANREKILSDAITKAGVIADDSQIDLLTILRGEPRPGGIVYIVVAPFTPAMVEA